MGDWTGWVRDPIDLIRLSFLVGALASALQGRLDEAVRFALTFAVVLVAGRLALPRPFDLALNVAMALQAWGSFAYAFGMGGYDLASRVVISAAVGSVAYLLFVRLRIVPDLSQETGIQERTAILLLGFCLGFCAGIVYELYVSVAQHALGAQLRVGYDDLIGRLALDATGALACAVLLVVWNLLGWGTRRLPARRVHAAIRR